MPAIDECQPQIIRALQKDGWAVEPKPFRVKSRHRTIHIDIEASRQANGSQQHIMLVEVKCFPDNRSATPEIYTAIGQYLVYRSMLTTFNLDIPLYLAVPKLLYLATFDRVIQLTLKESKINMLVVDLDNEVIDQWIMW